MTCWSVQAYAIFFACLFLYVCVFLFLLFLCMINVQTYLGDFIKNMCSTSLHLDAYKAISFNLDIVVGIAKLYILILIWMTLPCT